MTVRTITRIKKKFLRINVQYYQKIKEKILEKIKSGKKIILL